MKFSKFSDVCMAGNSLGEFAQDMSQLYKKRASDLSKTLSRIIMNEGGDVSTGENNSFLIERKYSDQNERFTRDVTIDQLSKSLLSMNLNSMYPRIVRGLTGYYPDLIPTDGSDANACVPEVFSLRELITDIQQEEYQVPDYYIKHVLKASIMYPGIYNSFYSLYDSASADNLISEAECSICYMSNRFHIGYRFFLIPENNECTLFTVALAVAPTMPLNNNDWAYHVKLNDTFQIRGIDTTLLQDANGQYLLKRGDNVIMFSPSYGPYCKIDYVLNDTTFSLHIFGWHKDPNPLSYDLVSQIPEACKLQIWDEGGSVYAASDGPALHFCNYVEIDDVIDQSADQIARLYALGLIFGSISESTNSGDFKKNLANAITFVSSSDSLLLSYLNVFQDSLTSDDDQSSLVAKALSYSFSSSGDFGEVSEQADDGSFIISNFLSQDSSVGSMAPWLSLGKGTLRIISKSSNAIIQAIGTIIELPFIISEYSYSVIKKLAMTAYNSFKESYISPLVFKTGEFGKRFLKQSKWSFKLNASYSGLGYAIGDALLDHVLYQVSIPGGYVYVIKDNDSDSIYFQIKPVLLSSDMMYGSSTSFYPDSVDEFADQVEVALNNPFVDTFYGYNNSVTPTIATFTGNEAILLAQRAGLDLFIQSIAGLAHDSPFLVDKNINISDSKRASASVIYQTIPQTLSCRSLHYMNSYTSITPMTILNDIFCIGGIIDNNYQSDKVTLSYNVSDASIVDLTISDQISSLNDLTNHPADLLCLTILTVCSLIGSEDSFINHYAINKVPDAMFALKTQNELNFGAYIWTAGILTVALGAVSIRGYFATRAAFQRSVLNNATIFSDALRRGDLNTAQRTYEKLRIQSRFGGIFGIGTLAGSAGTTSILNTLIPSKDQDLSLMSKKLDIISDKIS